MHYISLKPFSKKERRRQKAALAAEDVADMSGPAGALSSSSGLPGGGGEEAAEEDDEEYAPRSPVPLPDAATCRPILVQLGFSSLSSAEKTKKKKGKLKGVQCVLDLGKQGQRISARPQKQVADTHSGL